MRKSALLFIIATIIISACKKNDTVTDNPPTPPVQDVDFTTVPTQENINTEIIGYITNELNQPFTYLNVFQMNSNSSQLFSLQTNGVVNTGPISTDKNMSRATVYGYYPVYETTVKSFPVSSSIKNYVRIKTRNAALAGIVKNNIGGPLTIAGSGTINFGINSFYILPTQTSLGFFSPDLNSFIFSTYYNPEDKEFALRIPAYLAGDDGGKRWFLKSYGAISLAMSSGGIYSETMDFYAGNTGEIKLPITPTMQAGAPDSVIAWQLNNGVWTRGGWAKKQGNFYVAKIAKTGTWNFAQPVKGIYLTVNLRTDSNATVTNTAVRIKTNNRSIAESQTDADGNAVCFVPSNEPFTAEIIPDYRTDIRNSSFTFNIPAQNKAGAVTIKLPENSLDLSEIFGNVLNCNNEPVGNGVVKIIMSDNRDFYVPFSNGKFATAVWISGYNGNVNNAAIQVTDNAGNKGDVIYMSMGRNYPQFPNFYTCSNATALYCNFSIDNNRYEFKDNGNTAAPFLILDKNSATSIAYNTIRLTNSNNLGVNFGVPAHLKSPGSMYMNPIPDVSVNGATCTSNPGPGNTYPSAISYSRYDAAANGYVEGFFEFSYFINGNTSVSHKVKGNFKIKKNF